MHNATLKSYITGFILSIILTLAAYLAVMNHMFDGGVLLTIILFFAFLQMLVQLVFFLHMAKESRPHWNLVMLLSFASVIFIMVVGSLWIMHHLNYNMSPMQMNNYLLKDEGMRK